MGRRVRERIAVVVVLGRCQSCYEVGKGVDMYLLRYPNSGRSSFVFRSCSSSIDRRKQSSSSLVPFLTREVKWHNPTPYTSTSWHAESYLISIRNPPPTRSARIVCNHH